MVAVRRAGIDDAEELVRLRGVTLAAMTGTEPVPGPWQEIAVGTLRRRLPDPAGAMAAFVLDRPDTPGALAACAVGVIEYRLGDPGNPGGESGYVLNVATDPPFRHRGYSRACLRALLDWYRRRGIVKIDLLATPYGEPLYRQLGFTPMTELAMRLHLTTPATTP